MTTEAGCRIEKPWLAQVIFNRMDAYFNVQLSGSYALKIEVDEHYPHVIVGAPPNDPNQWIQHAALLCLLRFLAPGSK